MYRTTHSAYKYFVFTTCGVSAMDNNNKTFVTYQNKCTLVCGVCGLPGAASTSIKDAEWVGVQSESVHWPPCCNNGGGCESNDRRSSLVTLWSLDDDSFKDSIYRTKHEVLWGWGNYSVHCITLGHRTELIRESVMGEVSDSGNPQLFPNYTVLYPCTIIFLKGIYSPSLLKQRLLIEF